MKEMLKYFLYLLFILCCVGFGFSIIVMFINNRVTNNVTKYIYLFLLAIVLSFVGSILIVKLMLGKIIVKNLVYWYILLLFSSLVVIYMEMKTYAKKDL